MMGLIGMGNNPMVGATVACAVAAAQAKRLIFPSSAKGAAFRMGSPLFMLKYVRAG